jgi:NAD(P)-dependent dehydrogenase (short-subunit alcohol dehydrogenase family)
MDVNLRSAFTLTRMLLPSMAEKGVGSVVLTSSIAGLRGNRAIGLYGLSKAALSQLARNLAVEWGPSGIRVNAIAPGLIRTPLASELISNSSFMEKRLAMTPLRRVGEPDEVAGMVVLLAGKAGGFITGQTIVIDGGTLISDGS